MLEQVTEDFVDKVLYKKGGAKDSKQQGEEEKDREQEPEPPDNDSNVNFVCNLLLRTARHLS